MLYFNLIYNNIVQSRGASVLKKPSAPSPNCKIKHYAFIPFKQIRDSSLPLYQKSKILQLPDLIKQQHSLLAYQYKKNELPKAFADFCTPDIQEKYITRSLKIRLKVQKLRDMGLFPSNLLLQNTGMKLLDSILT